MPSISGNLCILLWVTLSVSAFSELFVSAGHEVMPKLLQKYEKNKRQLLQEPDCPVLNQCQYDLNTDQTIDWQCNSKLKLIKWTWSGDDTCNTDSTAIDSEMTAINDPCCVHYAAFINAECEFSFFVWRSDDGGDNYALKGAWWGDIYDEQGISYEGQWGGISGNTMFKGRCRREASPREYGSVTVEITYLGVLHSLDYTGNFEFNFADILGEESLPHAPCHDAVLKVWCGTLDVFYSLNGGESWLWKDYINNAGIMEESFSAYTFSDITSETKISVRCLRHENLRGISEPWVMATISYDGEDYSTMENLEENHFYFNGDYADLSFYDQSETQSLPLLWYDSDNIPDDFEVAEDAQWIYRDAANILLIFDFADVVNNIVTCAPTLSPTPAPTKGPTEFPSEAPTITCELRETTIPQQLQETFNLPPANAYSAILNPVLASNIRDFTIVDVSVVAQLLFDSTFMTDLVCITNDPTVYTSVVDYIKTWPRFYNRKKCKIDNIVKNFISGSVAGIGNPATAKRKLKRNVYNIIKDDIDEFALLLNGEQRNTTIAVTYTMEYCVDIYQLAFCTNMGFGFAFNFRGDEPIYYKTGSQGLTLESTPDFDRLPGSRQISVSYDILSDISNVAGNSYSFDVSISSGIVSDLVDNILGTQGAKFVDVGYSFSYLIGVNSLALSDIDTAKSIGFEFSKTIESISGAIIPVVAFGISRGATKIIGNQEYGELQGLVVENDPSTWCINEQFYTYECYTDDDVTGITVCYIRLDIES